MMLFEWEVNLQMSGLILLEDNHVQHAIAFCNIPNLLPLLPAVKTWLQLKAKA